MVGVIYVREHARHRLRMVIIIPRLHDTTGCQTGLYNRLDNRFDNRLYRVNGALGLGKAAGVGHAWTCPVVDILQATRQGAAPVRCGCRLGCTGWIAHWCNLANTIQLSVCGCDTDSDGLV